MCKVYDFLRKITPKSYFKSAFTRPKNYSWKKKTDIIVTSIDFSFHSQCIIKKDISPKAPLWMIKRTILCPELVIFFLYPFKNWNNATIIGTSYVSF